MSKDIAYKKIKTTIPEDAFISHIDNLIGAANHVTLKVTIEDIKVYELDNTMFVLMDMSDMSGKVKGLMVGSRGDKDFKSLVDDIYIGKKCKAHGKYCLLDADSCDVELPFELDDNRLFCIKAFQDLDSIQLYGVDITNLYNYDLEKAYSFVEANTNYFEGVSFNKVKNILFSVYKDIIILLKDGSLLFNGKKRLENIKEIVFLSGLSIFAISNDNTIKCLTGDWDSVRFLNANNYKYKKILYSPLVIVALDYDNNIKLYGTITDHAIDPERLVNVKDIGYVEENDDIVVIKDGKAYSLFLEHDYTNEVPEVIVEGSWNDIYIIE